MAIHNEVVQQMGAGHAKKIDAAGMDFMFQMAQKQQYQFPVKSVVREVISNAVDAVSDRKVAIEILTGKAKVEDYFVEREGDVYKDSKWDPTYYDLDWLSDNDEVEMHYIVGQGTNKDKVVILDNGVGLGGKRLEGYMNLAFSTKRLSKLPIGKFGVGGKAALSTGVQFYTTESRHNGKLFRFNVYDRTYDSIIPPFNLRTGKPNDFILFSEGEPDEYKVHYETTTEKNGVSVSFEVKKHHQRDYLDAVKSQLLYFTNVTLYIIHENGHKELVPHKAEILYEDDYIVLSDNPYYSKPHILLNKVTYGYVNFEELELEQKLGNIGIKVAPEDVEVNMSRESLIWGEKTKETILARFGSVVEIATRFINEELKEMDFWRWIKKCYSISQRYSERGGILGRLAGIVDLTQVNPVFPGDKRIKFKQDISDILDFDTTFVSYVTVNQKNQSKKVVDRKVVKNLGAYIGTPIIIRNADERASNRKDKYLLSLYPNGFIMMTEPMSHAKVIKRQELSKEAEDDINAQIAERKKKGWAGNYEIWELVLQSKDPIQYDTIEVPKDFTGTEEEEEIKEDESEEEIQQAKVIQQTAEERRKLEGKILVYTPRAVSYKSNHFTNDYNSGKQTPLSEWKITNGTKAYEWQKIEMPIKDINDWEAEEIYSCKEVDDELAHFVAMLTRDKEPDNRIGYQAQRRYANNYNNWYNSKWFRLNADSATGKGKGYTTSIQDIYYGQAFDCQHFFDAQVMIVKTSQANSKYFRDFNPIQEFFIKIRNNTITMSNTLIQWNTARLIKDKLKQAAFLFNFELFNSEMTEKYKTLTRYIDTHYREVQEQTGNGFYGLNTQIYSDLVQHLDNVATFQQYVTEHPDDKEMIGAMAQEFFGNKELRNGMAVDPIQIEMLSEVLEFAQGCGTLLCNIPFLTGYTYTGMVDYAPEQNRLKSNIPEVLEIEIKQYLEYKGMLNYGTSNETQDTNNAFETSVTEYSVNHELALSESS